MVVSYCLGARRENLCLTLTISSGPHSPLCASQQVTLCYTLKQCHGMFLSLPRLVSLVASRYFRPVWRVAYLLGSPGEVPWQNGRHRAVEVAPSLRSAPERFACSVPPGKSLRDPVMDPPVAALCLPPVSVSVKTKAAKSPELKSGSDGRAPHRLGWG